MRRLPLLLTLTAFCLLGLAGPSFATKRTAAPGYTLVGTAALVSPGDNSSTAVQITSNGPASSLTFGAIGFAVLPGGLKLSQVTTLATDYEMVAGACIGGAPRFTLGVAKGSTTHEIWFYFGRRSDGSIACPSGSYNSTGNLASPAFLVDTSQLPGGSYADPYSDVQARYGGYAIKYIAIDVDGGGSGDQTVDIDNTQVNGNLYTYEPQARDVSLRSRTAQRRFDGPEPA